MEYRWNVDAIKNGYIEVKKKLVNCENADRYNLSICLEHYEALLKLCDKYIPGHLVKGGSAFAYDDIDTNLKFSNSEKKDIARTIKLCYPKELLNLLLNVSEDLIDILDIDDIVKIPKRSLDYSTTISLASNMLKDTFDYSFSENIIKLLRTGNGHIHFVNANYNDRRYVESKGVFVPDCYRKKPYLLMEFNKTIGSLSSLIHELGHANEYLLNLDYYFKSPIETETLDETVAIFQQLLLYEFLYKKGIYAEDTLLDNINLLYYQSGYNYLIHDTLSIVMKSSLHKIKKYDLSNAKSFYLCSKYFLSFLVAIQFYYQYQDDKEYALNNLMNFIMSDKNDDVENILENAKVNIYDSSRYVKRYTKRIKTLAKY